MTSKNLLVIPTLPEIQLLLEKLNATSIDSQLYVYNDWNILIAGAGAFPFTYRLTHYLTTLNKLPEYALLAGVAGSYDKEILPGDVCHVIQERWGDCGAENYDGQYLTMSAIQLWPIDAISMPESEITHPFTSGKVINLPKVNSITVNVSAGCTHTIHKRIKLFNPDIENMEGAPFFKICQLHKIPCDEIRAISNKVEPRNRSAWKINEAISSLHDALFPIITQK